MARRLSLLGHHLGPYSDVIERAERAFDAIKDDDHARADLACELAFAFSLAGLSDRALEWSETALVLCEKADWHALLARAIGAKCYALYNLGRHREAVMLARGQVALADSAGSLGEQAWARSWVSIFALDDNPRESLSSAKESAELARRAGERGLEVWKLSDVAEISVLLGRWDDARVAVTELAQRELSTEDRVALACQMALLAGLSGDEKGAANYLEGEAAGLIAATELVAARTTYLRTRSLLSLAADDLEAAQQEAADAVSADPLGINSPHALMIQARAGIWLRDVEGARSALSAMTGFPGSWMAAERLTVEAGLAALEGRVEEAAETYREAIKAWRALDCTLDLALCELDLVVLLGPGAPHDYAAKEASEIFTRLGANPFLKRLNRAAGDQ